MAVPLRPGWVLADAQLRLLTVDTSLYDGQAARSQLDPTSRRHLLPMFRAVLGEAAAPVTRTVTAPDGPSWTLHARAVVGPSGVPHGVLGQRSIDGRPGPPAPLLGCWEWDVPRLVTRWTRELFTVYGYPEPTRADGCWEAPEFFDLLEVGERTLMRAVLERFHHAPSEELVVHAFEASHATTGVVQQLRLAGQTVWADGRPRWFRGLTMRVDGYARSDDTRNARDVLTAALALSTHPVCLVDVSDQRIYLRTDQWRSAGLIEPTHGRLASIVHPDDQMQVWATLFRAPAPPEAPAICAARVAGVDGWLPVDLAAVSVVVRAGTTARRHVLMKLRRRR